MTSNQEFGTNYGAEAYKNMARIISNAYDERAISFLNSTTKSTAYGDSSNTSNLSNDLTLVTALSLDDALLNLEFSLPPFGT